jgi:hypothetical protein
MIWHGLQHGMVKLLNKYSHLICSNHFITNGRLTNFLTWLWPIVGGFYIWIWMKVCKILSNAVPNQRQYEVTIGNFMSFIWFDFVAMLSCSWGWQGKWVPCKHIYYVLQHVMFCGEFENSIHFPTWSCNEFVVYCFMP